MSLPRTVGDVMREHVTLEVECIDRMYLNVYVPILQAPAGVAHFWRKHRGYSFASSALMQPMSKGFVRSIDKYVRTHGIPLVQFGRKERKDDVTQKHLARFTEDEGVLYVGKAQERAKVTRTQKRFDGQGRAYPWLVPSTSMVNHYYFYCVDTDFGPFFLKFCSYFPYNAKLCINGHE